MIERQLGAVVEFESVTKRYVAGGVQVEALREVSLQVKSGTIQAVIGASGAGKSTLFRCAAMLERPDAGRLLLEGVDLTRLRAPALRRARRNIGLVFQQLNLLASRTAARNVALPMELARVEARVIEARVRDLLGWVGLEARGESFPSTLSGGQRQRVAVARALAGSPRLLLCDEPTSALDPETTNAILDLLRRACDELGVTVLLITHAMNAVRRICDRVAVLEEGRVVEEGPAAEVLRMRGAA